MTEKEVGHNITAFLFNEALLHAAVLVAENLVRLSWPAAVFNRLCANIFYSDCSENVILLCYDYEVKLAVQHCSTAKLNVKKLTNDVALLLFYFTPLVVAQLFCMLSYSFSLFLVLAFLFPFVLCSPGWAFLCPFVLCPPGCVHNMSCNRMSTRLNGQQQCPHSSSCSTVRVWFSCKPAWFSNILVMLKSDCFTVCFLEIAFLF